MATFISLPGEIRNHIYDLALFPHHSRVRIQASHPKDLLHTTLKSPIFRLCRTIRHEAFARLCEQKVLEFRDYMSYRVCRISGFIYLGATWPLKLTTTLTGNFLTKCIQNFMDYAGIIGDGKVAKTNVKRITVFVHKLTMVEGDENLEACYLGWLGLLEASEVFRELHAVQVVRLQTTMSHYADLAGVFNSPQSSELAKELDQVLVCKYEIVTQALMERDGNVDGVHLRQICADTGLTRRAIFAAAPRF